MAFGDGCCLDKDNNKVCDKDEKKKPPVEVEENIGETEKPVQTNKTEKISSFKVNLNPVKDEIRVVDQAIFILTIENLNSNLQVYTVGTDKWRLLSNPIMNPIRLPVIGSSKNSIRLILQPPRTIEAGLHSVNLTIRAERLSESQNATVEVGVR
jgi:hypothetical protein